jgi:amino acid transporter
MGRRFLFCEYLSRSCEDEFMESVRRESTRARLSLWDAVSIILGIIIGVGIFRTPPDVFSKAPDAWAALGVWALGGVLALIGALCFAELATAYPRSGGEYVYLTRAFGPYMGFSFAWAQLAIIRTGSIALFGYLFADYADRLWNLGPRWSLVFSAGSIIVLTWINILGVGLGTRTQNLLTFAKMAGLAAIVFVGFAWSTPRVSMSSHAVAAEPGWFATAMILVLWTYSGWHEAAYIVAEVKNPRRNLPLALILGTAAVTGVYLLVNGAVLVALGFEGAKPSEKVDSVAVVAKVLFRALGSNGPAAVNLLVMVSALGALNGMIFTSARIYSEFGTDHRLFGVLSRWDPRLGTPVRALIVQGVLSVCLATVVSVVWGGQKGFEALIDSTAAVFWLFFLLTAIALIVLRAREPEVARPFRVPFYPVLPLVFCAWCAYMVVGAIQYRPWQSLLGASIFLVGLPLYLLPRQQSSQPGRVEEPTTVLAERE